MWCCSFEQYQVKHKSQGSSLIDTLVIQTCQGIGLIRYGHIMKMVLKLVMKKKEKLLEAQMVLLSDEMMVKTMLGTMWVK
jgi:hypothetical protein